MHTVLERCSRPWIPFNLVEAILRLMKSHVTIYSEFLQWGLAVTNQVMSTCTLGFDMQDVAYSYMSEFGEQPTRYDAIRF